jgi:hypothetical protein
MAVDDFMETEVGVAAGATALLLSPRMRGIVRRGVVYAVAGVMKGGDLAVSGIRSVVGSGSSDPVTSPAGDTPEPAKRSTQSRSRRPRGSRAKPPA